jgi:hypothetical protein
MLVQTDILESLSSTPSFPFSRAPWLACSMLVQTDILESLSSTPSFPFSRAPSRPRPRSCWVLLYNTADWILYRYMSASHSLTHPCSEIFILFWLTLIAFPSSSYSRLPPLSLKLATPYHLVNPPTSHSAFTFYTFIFQFTCRFYQSSLHFLSFQRHMHRYFIFLVSNP